MSDATASPKLTYNPKLDRFIDLGLNVLLAAALVLSLGSNLRDLGVAAIYVMLFALLRWLVGRLESYPVLAQITTVFAYLCGALWVTGFLATVAISAFAHNPAVVSPACYLRLPIENRAACEARLAGSADDIVIGGESSFLPPSHDVRIAGGPETLWLAQVSGAPAATPTDSTGRVFIQYADPVGQTEIQTLAAELTALNWAVQGAEDGGERVKDAPDNNEVRYFDAEDRDAAIELAESIYALSPTHPIRVRDFTRLGAYVSRGTLEVWLSHPLTDLPGS